MLCLPGLSLTIQINTLDSRIGKEHQCQQNDNAHGWHRRSGNYLEKLSQELTLRQWAKQSLSSDLPFIAVSILRRPKKCLPPSQQTFLLLLHLIFERLHRSVSFPSRRLSHSRPQTEPLSRSPAGAATGQGTEGLGSSLGTNSWGEAAPLMFSVPGHWHFRI